MNAKQWNECIERNIFCEEDFSDDEIVWKEKYEQILSRIRNNDEGLKHLRIIDCSDHRDYCLDYTAVIGHIHRFPNTLRDALRSNTVITSIEIQPSDYFEEEEDIFLENWGRPSEILARAIGAMSSVRHLTIATRDEGAEFLKEGRRAQYRDQLFSFFLRFVPHITTLCVKTCSVSQENAAVLDQALAAGRHPYLENLEYEALGDEGDDLEEYFPFPTSLSSLPKLKSISVEGYKSGPRLLGFPILPGNNNESSTLQQITLMHFDLDDRVAFPLSKNLEIGRHPNLTTIHVRCPANTHFFVRLADVAKHLTELKIWGDGYTYSFNDSVYSHLATYSLGLMAVLAKLKTSNNLKVLSVRDFVWDEDHLGLLRHLLDETPLALESLLLEFKDGEGLDGEGVNDGTLVSLATSLGRHASLKHLSLNMDDCAHYENLTAEGMHRADTILVASPSLVSYQNSSKRHYREPVFRWDMLDLECEKEVLNVLRTNYTLTHLHIKSPCLSCHRPTDVNVIWKQQQAILTLNSHGRRYMMEDRVAKEKGVALLAKIAAQPTAYKGITCSSCRYYKKLPRAYDLRLDCLFFHLSENPSLCDPTP